MIEASEFRRLMGHFATGVAVLSTCDGVGRPRGLTISSLCSVSLEPTLVLVCVDRKADSHDCIEQAGHYVVSILDEQRGEALARRFATGGLEDKFHGIAFHAGSMGAPVLDDALAWLECRVTDAYVAGDHTIFVGEVIAADVGEGTPLVYYRGGYGRFSP